MGRGGVNSGHVLSVLFIGVVDEVDLQVMMACMLAVLAVSQCESCAGLDLRQSQGILAFQFENGGRLRSNPVQEIHDQVDHDLHGPHRDGSHRHGEASRWPPAIIVCRPRLEELVDSFGELLSEGLVAVPRADMERRGPSCAINQQSVIIFWDIFLRLRDQAGDTIAFAVVAQCRPCAASRNSKGECREGELAPAFYFLWCFGSVSSRPLGRFLFGSLLLFLLPFDLLSQFRPQILLDQGLPLVLESRLSRPLLSQALLNLRVRRQ